MKIILNRLFPFGSYYAINLFGLVLSKRPLTPAERNHEYIHTLQHRELEWLVKLIIHRNLLRAYLSISFEREAYRHQSDIDYADYRPLWAWWKNLKH